MALVASEETLATFDKAQTSIDSALQMMQEFMSHIQGMRAQGMAGNWLDGLEEYASSALKIHNENHERVSAGLKEGKDGIQQMLDLSARMGSSFNSAS